jgi:hypothetical protein
MSTKEIIEKLISVINDKRPEVSKYIKKGISRKKIESNIKAHPIPDSLIEIYSCTSGSKTDDHLYLISPGWDLLNINDINEKLEWLEFSNKFMIENFPDYHLGMYSKHMIPFLDDDGGNIMCVKNLPDDQSVWQIPKDDEPYKDYISIDHFLLTSLQSYERGVYYLDSEEGFWEFNSMMLLEIKEEIKQRIENP